MMPGGSHACAREPLGAEPTPKRNRVDEVRERLHAVDLHDRDSLPIARLERRVAADVDGSEIVAADLPHDFECALAEVAAGGVVEDGASATDRAHA
jgi:hypothetical protein